MRSVETTPHRPRQIMAGLTTVCVALVLLSPLATGRDSFPLSTYPMYATARADTADLVSVVGISGDGQITRLSLDIIGGSDDPLIVESLVRTAINTDTADSLCQRVALRLAGGAEHVEVVTERHDLVALARDSDNRPLQRIVHASCPLRRR